MIELRFVKRRVPVTQNEVALMREVKILQSRSYVDHGPAPGWLDWTDVPLVEPEDEDKE
jgi:hypothetical protein